MPRFFGCRILLALAAALPLCAQTTAPVERIYTVATLPAASGLSGRTVWVKDAASATSCTAGSGTILVACKSNGSAWQVQSLGGAVSPTSLGGIALAGAAPTDGQAWLYRSGSNTLVPVAVPYWQKFTVGFGQLTGFNTTTGTVTLLARSNRMKVCGVASFIPSGFAGPSISAISFTVGDSNSTPNLYTPQAINVIDTGASDANVMGSAVGASNITATFTSVGANLAVLNQGSADIDVCLVQLP
jgi:hypothetical protein